MTTYLDEFTIYTELLEDSSILSCPGLVLAETIWPVLGSSLAFKGFSLESVWKPYEGVVYQPLIVSSDLKNKLNKLTLK